MRPPIYEALHEVVIVLAYSARIRSRRWAPSELTARTRGLREADRAEKKGWPRAVLLGGDWRAAA